MFSQVLPFRVIATASLVASLASIPCFAQGFAGTTSLPDAPSFQQAASHGTIGGEVSDITGGLVPGATVQLESKTHPGTALQKVTSDSGGRFLFADVEPGSYVVRIAANGLSTFITHTILLHPGEHFEVPEVSLPIATASTSVDVAADSHAVAEQELQIEVKQRVFGVFPNFYTSFIYNAAPLDAKQKFKLSFHSVSDPVVFISTGIVAGIEQAHNTFPEYGDDAASFGKRYGAAYGDATIGRLLNTAVLPAIFHQDPRYFYMGPANPTKKRFIHAIENGIIVRGDNGHRQPAFSRVLGNASAGAISALYHPDANGPGDLALRNGLIGIAGGSVEGLLREFLWSRHTHKVPSYAKGKTATPAVPPSTTPAATP